MQRLGAIVRSYRRQPGTVVHRAVRHRRGWPERDSGCIPGQCVPNSRSRPLLQEAGTGQVGAGLVEPPMSCFEQALVAVAETGDSA